jgi:general secretion pathway protein G
MRRKAVLATLAVVALALLEAELFVPKYVTSLRESHELTIRQNLITMRAVINQYTLNKHRRPRSLDDLVLSGYLKHVPVAPMTGREDTWIVECSNDPAAPGIVGINLGYRPATSQGAAHCD